MIPAACLFVFAFGGYVKGTFLLSALPVDITLVAALGVVLAVIGRVATTGRRYPVTGIVMILLLITAMTIGLLTAPATDYATTKRVEVLLVPSLCMVGGLLLLDSRTSRRAWLAGMTAYGPIVVAIALVAPSPLAYGRLFPEGGSTIGVGRAVGAALVIVWALALCRRMSPALLALVAAMPVLFAGLLMSGSRGPLAAALVSMAVISLTTAARARRAAPWGLAGVAAGLAGILLLGFAGPSRLTSLADASASLRFQLWKLTFTLGLDHPVQGIGWGNLYPYEDPSQRLATGDIQYPHNLVLEVASEAGLISLGLLLLVLFVATRTQWRAAKVDPVELAMLGLLVFFFVNALASGDIGSNRGLWVAVGCAWGARRSLSGRSEPAALEPAASAGGDALDRRTGRYVAHDG